MTGCANTYSGVFSSVCIGHLTSEKGGGKSSMKTKRLKLEERQTL